MIESVEAFVPACRVAAGLAVLGEGIDQRQRASIGVWCDLETDLIRPPTKLEQRWRLEGEHLAVEVAEIADESKRRTNGPLAIDPVREPRTEVLGIRQRAPDFVRCMVQRASKAQSPAVTGGFEDAVHLADLLCRVVVAACCHSIWPYNCQVMLGEVRQT